MRGQESFSISTLASASQLLASIAKDAARTVLQKIGIESSGIAGQDEVLAALIESAPEARSQLIDELILRCNKSLRIDAQPKYVFDERLGELVRCLALDGFEVCENALTRADPSSIELVQIRDALEAAERRDLSHQIASHVETLQAFDGMLHLLTAPRLGSLLANFVTNVQQHHSENSGHAASIDALTAETMFLEKQSRWAYEREWRMIVPLDSHEPIDSSVVLGGHPKPATCGHLKTGHHDARAEALTAVGPRWGLRP